MKIRINDKEFSKSALLDLITTNKIQAIIHIRSIVNLGLKEAKEIVDNLEENPNFYDHTNITKEQKDFVVGERVVVATQKENYGENFIIGGEVFPKEKLLGLVKKRKLMAIKFLRNVLKISLKDCKEIVDNLSMNPDYYEGNIIRLSQNSDQVSENVYKTANLNTTKRRKGNHFIKERGNSNKFIILVVLVILCITIYLFLKMK